MKKITSTVVSEKNRIAFLSNHLGPNFLYDEREIFKVLATCCDSLEEIKWHFYELSNGGFYLVPEFNENATFFVKDIGSLDKMSRDAAGVVMTLQVINHLIHKSNLTHYIKLYYCLLDYAEQHEEAKDIFAATD